MSRAKIQKKATFIDMTAMSDVTVLLLTFFMLTASFVKKEPVQVVTPSSVSEIKIPETNLLSILVDTNGKIFMSLDKQDDMANLHSAGSQEVFTVPDFWSSDEEPEVVPGAFGRRAGQGSEESGNSVRQHR